MVLCVSSFSLFAQAVCYSKREPNQGVLGIILAKCPNTVWVLHREKVVLGVVLSCYVVLCSRVVLCCVYLKSIGSPAFEGRM